MKMLIYLVLLLSAIFVVFLMVREYGRIQMANEKDYEATYRVINYLINKWDVTSANYERLFVRLKNLQRMPHKNREKTDVLVSSFFSKYGKVRIEKHLNK
jgi:hypothetical protein